MNVAAAFVILLGCGYTVGAIRDMFAASAARPRAVTMENVAHTDVDEASITFTNQTGWTAYACVRGVVTAKASGAKVESFTVCTGDVKNNSTVHITTRYAPIGAVLDLCHGDAGPLGMKRVDWDKCTFAVKDVTARP